MVITIISQVTPCVQVWNLESLYYNISMNQRRNKRRLRTQLVFVYTLMALAVVSIVAILILVIQGYRYNRYDGKVEQGGLVQFDSRPSGATVSADGTVLANRTASKITLTSGKHTISMARDGYSSWTHEATVKPGGVLWLNYTLLYPTNPVHSNVAALGTVVSALPSPDSKRIATVTSDNGVINLTTLDTDTPGTTKITITADGYTPAGEGESKAFSLLSWDKDNRQVLVRYTHGASVEYLSVNLSDGTARNITKRLGVDIDTTMYSLADTNVVYVLTANHELRRANLADMTLSGPLASNVSSISITEKNSVQYATLPDEKGVRTIGYVSSGATKAKTLFEYPGLASTANLAGLSGTYYGDHYVVASHGDTIDIYRLDLPSSDTTSVLAPTHIGSMTLAGGATYLGFSADTNRFIYGQRDNTIVTYDLELVSSARITALANLTRRAEWIDAFHVATTVGGSGTYSDFDGTNGVSFATNIDDLPVVLSSGNKYLYYFSTTNGTTNLMRAKMTN